MDNNDIAYAVKQFQKQKEHYTFSDFCADLSGHKRRRPGTNSSYDPFSMWYSAENLLNVLNMSMHELVTRSGMNMASFARRFCIPYRTLQAWCDETNECPVYIKLMLSEILGLLRPRAMSFTPSGR